jgi:acyl-CoA dehydrogenase
MAWDFSTDPEFEEQLAWMGRFVAEEVEPLELLWPEYHHRVPPPWLKKVIDPLKQQVRDRGLWACHLGPELGGRGFGQVKLSLMNEILAPYQWGPTIFGVQGPDTGNAEIIAHYGTPEQKAKYLQPLLDGEVFSTFAMTEPAGGSDPTLFTFRARRDGDEWVLDGEKFFASNASYCAFYIVMAVSDPDVHPYKGMSMFFVEADTPGIEIVRPTGYMNEPYGHTGSMDHPHVRFNSVRVPAKNLLGAGGDAFVIAQTRLSGGRIHHAMRAVGQARYAFDMMCERALSRRSGDGLVADKQMVQEAIAQSYAQLEMFRLFILRTAWMIDQGEGYTRQVRRDIATAKMLSAQVMRDVVERAVHIHGALGVSNEMPLGELWQLVPGYGIWDGPTEAHVTIVARQVLKDHQPADGMWPSHWRPERLRRAREKHAGALAEQAVGND